MDNYHENEGKYILINFDNYETNEYDHDYSQPYNRRKSSAERNFILKDENISNENNKSKNPNKVLEERFCSLNQLKKEFNDINEEYISQKNNFSDNIIGNQYLAVNEFTKIFSFVEKQNIMIKVI